MFFYLLVSCVSSIWLWTCPTSLSCFVAHVSLQMATTTGNNEDVQAGVDVKSMPLSSISAVNQDLTDHEHRVLCASDLLVWTRGIKKELKTKNKWSIPYPDHLKGVFVNCKANIRKCKIGTGHVLRQCELIFDAMITKLTETWQLSLREDLTDFCTIICDDPRKRCVNVSALLLTHVLFQMIGWMPRMNPLRKRCWWELLDVLFVTWVAYRIHQPWVPLHRGNWKHLRVKCFRFHSSPNPNRVWSEYASITSGQALVDCQWLYHVMHPKHEAGTNRHCPAILFLTPLTDIRSQRKLRVYPGSDKNYDRALVSDSKDDGVPEAVFFSCTPYAGKGNRPTISQYPRDASLLDKQVPRVSFPFNDVIDTSKDLMYFVSLYQASTVTQLLVVFIDKTSRDSVLFCNQHFHKLDHSNNKVLRFVDGGWKCLAYRPYWVNVAVLREVNFTDSIQWDTVTCKYDKS